MSLKEDHTGIRIDSKADFEQLFNEHYGNLCAYANNFLKDVDASEEVVQDVLFKLWTNKDHLVITSSVKSYLFRSVRNACLNVIKHVNVREEYKTFNEAHIREAQRSSEDDLMYTEMQETLYKAIEELAPQRRKVFIMSRYDGLKYQEIADKLGVSIKTIEKQMVKALQHLRAELGDYLPVILVLSLIHCVIALIRSTFF
mgnify:CR=1 FL=1